MDTNESCLVLGTALDAAYMDSLKIYASSNKKLQRKPLTDVDDRHLAMPSRSEEVMNAEWQISEIYLPRVRAHEAGYHLQVARSLHYLPLSEHSCAAKLISRMYVDGIILLSVAQEIASAEQQEPEPNDPVTRKKSLLSFISRALHRPTVAQIP